MPKQYDSSTAVAIVGIGSVFPQAPSPADFWQLVKDARTAFSTPPPGRWRLPLEEAYHPAEGQVDRVYSRRGCYIDNFDFTLPWQQLHVEEELLRQLDPMFQILLQAGHQAWSDCNNAAIDPARTGVIIGNLALPNDSTSQLAETYLGRTFAEQAGLPYQRHDTHPLNRFMTGLPAATLAAAFGLGGCCFTLDAACASALYAVKLAVDELQSGRADMMLTGGVARPDALYTQMGFSQLHALSPTGTCSPFDINSDGLVVGEGAGILALKRLDDAVRDGDHIYARIAAIGLSNDIGGSLLAPMSEGQLRAMRAAYTQAGWHPQDVDHIECHATGTPVGDAVEFNSLCQLWDGNASAGTCVLGGVKSNIGHLLTAAGAAATIKTLLALKEGILPPTAGFTAPAAAIAMDTSPFTVLRQAQPWPQSQRPRRAAVSAFGFGGINAHVLLEEYQPATTSVPITAPPPATSECDDKIAIIAMDATLGDCTGLDNLRRHIFSSAAATFTAPQHWYGATASAWYQEEVTTKVRGLYLDRTSVTAGQFRIPPTELKEMLPRQALMLQCAAAALQQANLSDEQRRNAGVFVGTGLDLNATSFSLRWGMAAKVRQWAQQQHSDIDAQQLEQWQNSLQDSIAPPLTANRTMGALGSVVASRIAREFKIGGPSFTIASEENSAVSAMHSAISALTRGEISCAIVGAVDMPGDIRAQLSNVKLGRATAVAEGAGAVVLKTLRQAQQDNDTIYAVIDACVCASAADSALLNPAPEQVAAAATHLPAISDAAPTYLDVVAEPSVDNACRRQLQSVCADGCHNAASCATFGHSGEASGIIAIIQAALALHHVMLPGGKEISPRYWLHNRQDGPRRALVTTTATGGVFAHTLLSQWSQHSRPLARLQLRQQQGDALFAVHGACPADLLQQLEQLRRFDIDGDLRAAMRAWHQLQHHDSPTPLCATMVADDPDQLRQQIDFLTAHLSNDAHRRLDGSGGPAIPSCARERVFYAAQPLGRDAKIAFVYPGSGNHFIGMGMELSRQWPQIFERQHHDNQRLKDQYQADKFWGDYSIEQIETDHNAMIIAHVAMCTALSDAVRQMGIEPDMAIGYSLGESSSLFSLGVWQQRDAMLERIEQSTLFTSDLAGECTAARTLWQLPADEPVNWCLGIVPRPAAQVHKALDGLERAYLLIINTTSECIIGGQRRQVEQAVTRLDCPFVELHGVTTVHCPVPTVVRDAYRTLHLFPTTAPAGIDFYSCASGERYHPTSAACADAILNQALHTIDFTRVVNNASAAGAQVFIETGTGNSCSRMLQQILAGRDCVISPTCMAQHSPLHTFTRLAARLLAEGLSCDITMLLDPQQPPLDTGSSDKTQIVLHNGGSAFTIAPPPRVTRDSFSVYEATEPAPPAATAKERPPADIANPLLAAIDATMTSQNQAHGVFLDINATITALMQHNLHLQQQLRARLGDNIPTPPTTATAPQPAPPATAAIPQPPAPQVAFTREQCMEFAVGSIAKMLGERFAPVDSHPSRVRLPDEPLMLVDRIITVEGEACSMTSGRVVTEHDVTAGRWYLDGGRIPTCIAVEAGQADLFLSGYLGIDFHTKGLAVYRLLDAVVEFHDELPQVGSVIRYDIRIEHFFRQGDTWLFRFRFDSSVDGKPLLTMRNGCAGFFSAAELDAGQGIVHTRFDVMEQPGKLSDDWVELVPMAEESYSEAQIAALRNGNLVACFGAAFSNLNLPAAYTLPGGHLELVDRVSAVRPGGGRFGLGQIEAQMDIHPDDWFLTCHFCDDNVMPGTLMYECCLHTLRIYLMRMGWVSAPGEAAWQPLPGIKSQLKCRGQVTENTRTVTYLVTIKEMGYRPQPYAIVDALMYADGKPIVEIIDMSVQISGLTREKLLQRWRKQTPTTAVKKAPVYDYASILAYSSGKPSEAFGEPYRIFDSERRIARLPRPPFQFLDRITAVNAEAWKMVAGGTIEGQYDIPADAWYFAAGRQQQMPFAVLLEIALQPCGWMAAYVGSALTSAIDLSFRNLDGNAVQLRPVTAASGTLTTTVKLTRVSSSGGMIIQSYDFCVRDAYGDVYRGDTVFGFFSAEALANQVGIRDAALYEPDSAELTRATSAEYPRQAPFPADKLRMIDHIDIWIADGGSAGLGYIRASKVVDPDEWFFHAHFYQDPVCPGSLGLESFMQLLKYMALQRWNLKSDCQFAPITRNHEHHWMYRGQIIPTNSSVSVEAVVSAVDDEHLTLYADGYLSVDGKVIYQMKDFAITAERT